jgi:transcriptional regulator with PAS, ATPase and Fis domain
MLQAYPFAGNIRELANEIERAVIMADPGAPISDDLLSEHVREAAADGAAGGALQHRTDSFERDQILAALERAGGVKSKAAEELGITPRGLAKKMQRLGV